MVSGVRTCIGLLIMLISLGFSPIATASACGQEYVCREALVKFSKHLDLQGVQITLMEADAEVLQYFEGSRVYHIHFLNNEGTLKQIVSLWEQPYVLMVSPNWRVSAHTLPDDPDFGNLWGLRSVDNQGNDLGIDIRMEEVWGQLTLGSEVIVAVIDSGIDYEHEDLADNMWVNSLEANGTPGVDDDGNGYVDDVHGYDFMNNDGDPMDDHKHGTHVAGTIGAVGNNGIGVTGVTWSTNVKLMAIKFLNSAATGNLSDAMAGMEYAVTNGATILNNSWGSGVFDMALKNAIFSSDEQGAIFFAAAGNQSRNTDQLPFYPASYDVPNIVSVGATTELDKLWNGSNYGNLSVDFAAPGASVYSTFPNDSYGYLTGTSMATPHAAGAAALLWSQFPELSHRQIINLLLQGTQAKVYLEGKTRMGGILNVANSLAIANNPDNHPPVANAGSDNTLPLGVIINLQGAASDEDGDFPLTFEWSLTPPEGSNTQLNDPFSQSPSFIPDQEGDYVLMLVVHDSLSSSVPDSITITIEGGAISPPQVALEAVAQDPQSGQTVDLSSGATVRVGHQVRLDGSNTVSLFQDQLLFEWVFIATPPQSVTALSNSDTAITHFIPDIPGSYTIRLNVEDGFGESSREITIVASENPQNPGEETETGEDDPNSGPQFPAAGGCSLHPQFL